jgi:hypothetical protein
MGIVLQLVTAVLVLGALQTRAAELSPKETQEAQKLYNLKCAKCHKIYEPAGYSKADWDGWMKKMGKKSKLKPAQYDLLVQYTETLRQPLRSRAGKP